MVKIFRIKMLYFWCSARYFAEENHSLQYTFTRVECLHLIVAWRFQLFHDKVDLVKVGLIAEKYFN